MSVTVNMKDLLEAGVHYGHQCRRWNPKMSKYIFGSRNGIHIIDLQQTVTAFKKACDFLESVTATGGHVLFVGTKRQSQEILATEALRSKQFLVNHRWLGGTLTNFQTVKASIHLLKKYEKASVDGTISKLTKKEALNLSRERDKLDRNLGGIKDMPGRPRAVFIADAHKERIAIEEARRLKIPIVAITDTNADPDGIDYPIPGNDDSIKAIQYFLQTAADACLAGSTRGKDKSEMDQGTTSRATKPGTIYDKEGHAVKVEKKEVKK